MTTQAIVIGVEVYLPWWLSIILYYLIAQFLYRPNDLPPSSPRNDRDGRERCNRDKEDYSNGDSKTFYLATTVDLF